jgi:hypothetical protein
MYAPPSSDVAHDCDDLQFLQAFPQITINMLGLLVVVIVTTSLPSALRALTHIFH